MVEIHGNFPPLSQKCRARRAFLHCVSSCIHSSFILREVSFPSLISFSGTIRDFPTFSKKSFSPDSTTRCLYRGYCHPGGCFGPYFLKIFQKFFGFGRPGRCASPTSTDGRATTRRPLYSFFFGKRSVKNLLFPKKNEIFPAFANELSIGVTARHVEKWPLFFEKKSVFFRSPAT